MQNRTTCRECGRVIDVNVNDMDGNPIPRRFYEFSSNNIQNELSVDIDIAGLAAHYDVTPDKVKVSFDALIEAARHEHPEIVQWLVEKKLRKELTGRYF